MQRPRNHCSIVLVAFTSNYPRPHAIHYSRRDPHALSNLKQIRSVSQLYDQLRAMQLLWVCLERGKFVPFLRFLCEIEWIPVKFLCILNVPKCSCYYQMHAQIQRKAFYRQDALLSKVNIKCVAIKNALTSSCTQLKYVVLLCKANIKCKRKLSQVFRCWQKYAPLQTAYQNNVMKRKKKKYYGKFLNAQPKK